MGTILLFLVVLSLLVFVHELGHFLMAKKMGMKVEEFGFGFPPRVFGIKKGDTTYSINWIPLGGFVKIKGESGENAGDSDSFASKKPWQRFLVLIAGVVMNLVLAGVLLSVGFMMGMPSVINENTPAHAHVEDSKLTVMTVVENSPAFKAGIQQGASITHIDGKEFLLADDAREYMQSRTEDAVELTTVSYEGERSVNILISEQLKDTDVMGVGIGFIQTAKVSFAPHYAVVQGVVATGQFTFEITKAFGSLITNLVTRQDTGVELSGPVGIAVMTGQVAAKGFVYLLQFAAMLSINLAIINVLPFPALDGGRILFLAIEKLRGKVVNQKIEIAVHNIGFTLLMVLVVLVTYGDFINFGDEILGAIKSMIGV